MLVWLAAASGAADRKWRGLLCWPPRGAEMRSCSSAGGQVQQLGMQLGRHVALLWSLGSCRYAWGRGCHGTAVKWGN